jgi:hypothetical protein
MPIPAIAPSIQNRQQKEKPLGTSQPKAHKQGETAAAVL